MSRDAIGRRVDGHEDTMADKSFPGNRRPTTVGDDGDGTDAVDRQGMAQTLEPAGRGRGGKEDDELWADLHGRGQQAGPGEDEKGYLRGGIDPGHHAGRRAHRDPGLGEGPIDAHTNSESRSSPAAHLGSPTAGRGSWRR
jgi:hypothetical protein